MRDLVDPVATSPPDLPGVIESLPRDHLVALRAALAGGRAEEVAVLAGVPVEALVPLLRVAAAKLDHALEGCAPPVSGARDTTPR